MTRWPSLQVDDPFKFLGKTLNELSAAHGAELQPLVGLLSPESQESLRKLMSQN